MQSIEFKAKYNQLASSLEDAAQILVDEDSWSDAISRYDEKVNIKRDEMDFDVYDDWVNNNNNYLSWRVKELATVIHVHDGETDWQNHFHATLCVKVENRRQTRYVSFSHAALMIQCVSMSRREWTSIVSQSDPTRRVLAHVHYDGDLTLEVMLKASIAHWYNTNCVRQTIQWPASCTGFTDFLMFLLFGKNYLNECILSLAYNKTYHAIYHEDGIQKVNINRLFNAQPKKSLTSSSRSPSPKRTRSGAKY